MIKTGLILAIDTTDPIQANEWIEIADDSGQMIKIGMEFTYACGFEAVRKLAQGRDIFLDLKLHDIPNTVASAIASLVPIKPKMLTIHSLGGKDMVMAARQAINDHFEVGNRPVLLGVTVLTSMNQDNLNSIGISATPMEQVLHLGEMAVKAGVDGLVCSPLEVRALRDALGDEIELIVPGIRMKDSRTDDQQRIMTPREAKQAGASWVVVGRPITKAVNPHIAMKTILSELQG